MLGRDGAPVSREALPAVVVAAAGRRLALAVEEIVGEHEIIIKDLPGVLSRIDVLGGATILGDGRVVPVLNPEGLIRRASENATSLSARAAASKKRVEMPRVVIADDSATTRMLVAGELEAVGYRVLTACDGREALGLLETHGAGALVSDLNMPNMDGLELTRIVRRSERLRDIPVILVTSCESEDEKSAAAEAGASFYIIKKDFTGDTLRAALSKLIRGGGAA
jgi:two-component system chemotaxis sensor kinase CheA